MQRWLDRYSRFHVHLTPTDAPWINDVEGLFNRLSQGPVRRAVFRDVEKMTAAIEDYVGRYNSYSEAFIWTAKADEISKQVNE